MMALGNKRDKKKRRRKTAGKITRKQQKNKNRLEKGD